MPRLKSRSESQRRKLQAERIKKLRSQESPEAADRRRYEARMKRQKQREEETQEMAEERRARDRYRKKKKLHKRLNAWKAEQERKFLFNPITGNDQLQLAGEMPRRKNKKLLKRLDAWKAEQERKNRITQQKQADDQNLEEIGAWEEGEFLLNPITELADHGTMKTDTCYVMEEVIEPTSVTLYLKEDHECDEFIRIKEEPFNDDDSISIQEDPIEPKQEKQDDFILDSRISQVASSRTDFDTCDSLTMPKGGKTKANATGKQRKAAPPCDPSPVQESPSKAEVEDTQEEFGNAKKKQRLHVKLTDDQEDQLVGLIQENTNLYDKANKHWLNKDARRQTWQEIAMKMELPVNHLMSWFHSMRTRFGRLKKTKSSQGATKVTDRDKWILRVFDFLCPHIVEISRRNAVSLKEKIASSRSAETANTQASRIAACRPVEMGNGQASIEAPLDLDDDMDGDYPGPTPYLNDLVPGPASQPTKPVSPPTHPTQPTPRTSRRKASALTAATQDDLLLKIHHQSIRTIDLLRQSNEIMRTLRPAGVNERISFGQWFTNVLVQLPESVYDSLVDDVFALTKSAKIEARRHPQQEQPQVQRVQPRVQQSQVQEQ